MTAPCSSLGRTRTPRLIVIVRKPRTVAPRGPGEGGTSRSPVRPGRGKECDARSTRVRRPLADHPRLRWLGRKSRLTSGQRAPLHPASGPYPPRADPFATRTPVGLLHSPARGGQILHACRKDTVVAWRLSNTIDGSFCLEMLEEALRSGKPEVFNTDQGVQF